MPSLKMKCILAFINIVCVYQLIRADTVNYIINKSAITIGDANPYFGDIINECEKKFASASDILKMEMSQAEMDRICNDNVIIVEYSSPKSLYFHITNHTYSVQTLYYSINNRSQKTYRIMAKTTEGVRVFVHNNIELNTALELLEKARQFMSSQANSVSITEEAKGYLDKKEYYKAIYLYEEAIKKSKIADEKSVFYFNLASIFKLLNQNVEQATALKNAIQFASDKTVRCDYLELYGKVLVELKLYAEARLVFQEVCNISNKDWQIKSARINLFKIDNFEGVLQSNIYNIEQKVINNSQDIESLNDLVIIYDEVLSQYSKALPIYEKLSAAQPDNILYLTRLQFCYEQTGRLDKAISVYEKLMAKDPQAQVKVLDRAVELAIKAKQPQKAIQWGRQYAESKANDSTAHAMLARIAFRVEDFPLAAEAFAKAESLETNGEQRDKLITEQIAVAEKQKDKPSIEKHIRRLVKMTKSADTKATGLLMLVRFLQQENRLDEMVTW
jgi:tetratricopeptide (TPR) repeat protein